MVFFNSPIRIYDFYINFKQSPQKIVSMYDLNVLKIIIKEINTITDQHIDSKSDDAFQLVSNIKQAIIQLNQYENDPIVETLHTTRTKVTKAKKNKVKKNKATKAIKVQPRHVDIIKTYIDMSVDELQQEITQGQLYNVGTKQVLIERLTRMDNGKSQLSDMSTKWLKTELDENKLICPRARKDMIQRLIDLDNGDILLGQLTDFALHFFWDKYKVEFNLSETPPSRNNMVHQLQIIKIKELRSLVKELDRKLYQCQQKKSVYRTYQSKTIKDNPESWGSMITRGVMHGLAVGVVSNLLTHRH